MTERPKGVYLDEQDLAVVTEFAIKLGVSFSSALRIIIRDWNSRIVSETANKIEATK